MKVKIEGEVWEVSRLPMSAGQGGKGIWRIEKPGVSIEMNSNCSLQEFLNHIREGDGSCG